MHPALQRPGLLVGDVDTEADDGECVGIVPGDGAHEPIVPFPHPRRVIRGSANEARS
ncbi:unnamed protein product [[Actinomadura] parvosata subsp. kistnae]|nr:unnamed protein product [Actinomadura parvosata subsp. kistnae]